MKMDKEKNRIVGINRVVGLELSLHRPLCLTWFITSMIFSSVYAEESAVAPMDCVINPSMLVDLGSGEDGVLNVIHVDRSDLVHKGDVIAVLDSGVEQAALDLASSRATLTAELDLRRVNAEFVNRQQNRAENLYEKKVISSTEIDQNKTEAEVSFIQYRQAQENQRLARLDQARAEASLMRRTIRSPIMGVVTERFKSIGEYVNEQPIVRLAQLDPLHIEVLVPVEQASRLRQGMLADVWSDALGGHRWKAEVSRVDQVADIASGTLGVRLSLANPEYKIRAGVRCQVSFTPERMTPKSAARAIKKHQSKEKVEAQQMSAKEAPQSEVFFATPALATAKQCSWLGPYDSTEAAQTEAHLLRSDTLKVNLRTFSSTPVSLFRITSAEPQSKTAAGDTLRRLHEVGEKDSYRYRTESGKFFVSIGFYKDKQNALQHQDSLQDKNLTSRVVRQEFSKNNHWLRLVGSTAALDFETQTAINKSYLQLPKHASCQLPANEGG